jgi:hypothetical protein
MFCEYVFLSWWIPVFKKCIQRWGNPPRYFSTFKRKLPLAYWLKTKQFVDCSKLIKHVFVQHIGNHLFSESVLCYSLCPRNADGELKKNHFSKKNLVLPLNCYDPNIEIHLDTLQAFRAWWIPVFKKCIQKWGNPQRYFSTFKRKLPYTVLC